MVGQARQDVKQAGPRGREGAAQSRPPNRMDLLVQVLKIMSVNRQPEYDRVGSTQRLRTYVTLETITLGIKFGIRVGCWDCWPVVQLVVAVPVVVNVVRS